MVYFCFWHGSSCIILINAAIPNEQIMTAAIMINIYLSKSRDRALPINSGESRKVLPCRGVGWVHKFAACSSLLTAINMPLAKDDAFDPVYRILLPPTVTVASGFFISRISVAVRLNLISSFNSSAFIPFLQSSSSGRG